MMYICAECGQTFEEPARTEYVHDEVPPPNIETFYVSPCCGDEYYPAVECCMCGDAVPEEESPNKSEYIRFKCGDVVCDGCLHDYCNDNFT